MINLPSLVPRFGHYIFIFGFLAVGIQHFVFGDFVVGRAPAWEGEGAARYAWAYCTGAFFVAAGLLMILNFKVRIFSLTCAFIVLVWAFLRHVPVLFTTSFLSSEWTTAGKALVFVGGLLTVAASGERVVSKSDSPMEWINSRTGFLLFGRCALGVFLLITGIQHFMYVEFVASLIPTWFPGDPVFWTYFAGVTLLMGGVGLLIRATAGIAAFLSGLMIFSWFWIVHVPRAWASLSDQLAVFEALAFSGFGFMLAGALAADRSLKGETNTKVLKYFMILVAVALASCGSPSTATIREHEFADILENISKGWNEGNAGHAIQFFHNDAVYEEPPATQLYKGRNAIFQFFGGEHGFDIPMKMAWHNTAFNEAAQVGFAEYTFEMNKRYHGIVTMQFEQGKIIRWREYQYTSELSWDEFARESRFRTVR